MAQWASNFGGSSGGNYTLFVDASVIAQEEDNNRSLVRFNAWVHKNTGSGFYNFSGGSGSVTINGSGQGRSWGGYDFRQYTDKYIAQNEDYWVNHNSNGDGSSNWGASWDMQNSPFVTSTSTGGTLNMGNLYQGIAVNSITFSNITDVGFNVTVNTNRVANRLELSIDGSGYAVYFNGTFTSRTVTVSPVSSGAVHTVRARVRRNSNGRLGESGTVNVTTAVQNRFFDIFEF